MIDVDVPIIDVDVWLINVDVSKIDVDVSILGVDTRGRGRLTAHVLKLCLVKESQW